MNPSQTNTRPAGPFPMAAASDLTGKEGYLAKITSGGEVDLLDDKDDPFPLLIVKEAEEDELADVLPLLNAGQVRLALKGTCSPGDKLVPADPSTSADAGKVRALPESAGTYKVVAYALETGVDGQLVLAMPFFGDETVASS